APCGLSCRGAASRGNQQARIRDPCARPGADFRNRDLFLLSERGLGEQRLEAKLRPHTLRHRYHAQLEHSKQAVRDGGAVRVRAPASGIRRQASGVRRHEAWVRHARTFLEISLVLGICSLLLSCSQRPDPDQLVMIIESSPTNLDPRIGLDAQSQNIDGLLFENLLSRNEHLSVKPGLAERWEIPDPKTYIFHLRRGVKFADGRALTSRDVKWSFDSLLERKIRTTKTGTFTLVERIDAPDDSTIVFHLTQPWAGLLWNLAGGEGMGIVPCGSLGEVSAN